MIVLGGGNFCEQKFPPPQTPPPSKNFGSDRPPCGGRLGFGARAWAAAGKCSGENFGERALIGATGGNRERASYGIGEKKEELQWLIL